MFTVIVGTYEHSVIAWQSNWTKTEEEEDEKLELKMIFAHPSHLGSVSALASHGNYLASGSTDESIKIYDLKNKKEVGSIIKHSAKITSLQFHQNSHLISGSEDGQMCIFRSKDWECIRSIKAHKECINCISIHPSGKIALTCSRDRTLRIWNLSNGRCAYDERLNYEPELIQWSPSGNSYAISAYSTIRVYSSDGKIVYKYDQSRYEHILSMVFLKENIIASGGEDRKITVWSTQTGEILHSIGGFTNRIKSLSIASKKNNNNNTYDKYLISISSDQYIRVWDLDVSTSEALSQVYLESRLTSLTVSDIEEDKEDE